MNKKILVITYYWPPSGGGGVQRWLKFVKHFPEFGWEPIVFTPENPEFDQQDPSLEKDVDPNLEVIRFPIWEPMRVYKNLFKKNKKEKFSQGVVIEKSDMSWKERLVIWIRANLMIPDPRRFWVRPSVDFLVPFIQQHEIDTVVTTGPPHSMHLIGLGLKRKTQIKWIADLRDPWSDWDLLKKLKVTKLAMAIHQRMEKKVVLAADVVLSTCPGYSELLKERYSLANIQTITNGVDPDDFEIEEGETNLEKFTISHLGLLNEIRNPEVLWEVLEELCEDVDFASDLKLQLGGMVAGSVKDKINGLPRLSKRVEFLDYLSHKKVMGNYQKSSLLLLLTSKQDKKALTIPGKLFEYLLANRRILAIGNTESDVQSILSETNAGEVQGFDDKLKIKEVILAAYASYKNGQLGSGIQNTDKYLRKNLTEEVSVLLNSLRAQSE